MQKKDNSKNQSVQIKSTNENESEILFEQPLNEYMRLCLRLENLLQKFDYFLANDTVLDNQVCIETLFDILSVIDRPDLKNKLGQLLNQYIASYVNLEKNPQVDVKKLQVVLNELRQAMDILQSLQGKLGQDIKENEFLSSIQQRLNVPAWSCAFNLPSFHVWLQLDPQTKKDFLIKWSAFIFPLRKIVALLLRVMRESVALNAKIAKAGFYQTNLDPNIAYQMIRIKVNAHQEAIYPEISVGRHRLTLHFFVLNLEGKSNQVKDDVDFYLACCKL